MQQKIKVRSGRIVAKSTKRKAKKLKVAKWQLQKQKFSKKLKVAELQMLKVAEVRLNVANDKLKEAKSSIRGKN